MPIHLHHKHRVQRISALSEARKSNKESQELGEVVEYVPSASPQAVEVVSGDPILQGVHHTEAKAEVAMEGIAGLTTTLVDEFVDLPAIGNSLTRHRHHEFGRIANAFELLGSQWTNLGLFEG